MTGQTNTLPGEHASQAVLEAHRGIVAGGVAPAMRAPQLALDFYGGLPDPAGHTWHAFTLTTPEEEAAAVFLRRYGRQPEYVFESRGLLLAGPVPSEVLP